jgi:hypothetical protein
MGFLRTIPAIKNWLDESAESWTSLSDPEYAALVRRWRDAFLERTHNSSTSLQGAKAMAFLDARLPADLLVISGLRIDSLCNAGGCGPAGYQARGVRSVPRDFANEMELIIVSADFSWSCVYSHEADAFFRETLYFVSDDSTLL